MTFRIPWPSCCLALGLLACSGVEAQVPPPGSELPSPVGVPPAGISFTNSPRATRKDGLRYLEEELSKSLQFFSGKNALDGVMAPAPLSAPRVTTIIAPKRSSSEESDKGEGWSRFAERRPDSESSMDTMKLPGRSGMDRKKTGFDQFAEKLNRESAARYNSDPRDRFSQNSRGTPEKTDSGAEDYSMPRDVREKERSLREKIFGGEAKSDRIYNPVGGGLFSDLFNKEEKGMTREEEKAHNDFLERYRQVIAATPVSPGIAETFKTPAPGMTSQPVTSGSYDFFNPTPRRDTPTAIPWSASSSLGQHDFNSQVLNRWNPLYDTPKYEPAPAMPRQAPAFMDPPRRRF